MTVNQLTGAQVAQEQDLTVQELEDIFVLELYALGHLPVNAGSNIVADPNCDCWACTTPDLDDVECTSTLPSRFSVDGWRKAIDALKSV